MRHARLSARTAGQTDLPFDDASCQPSNELTSEWSVRTFDRVIPATWLNWQVSGVCIEFVHVRSRVD